MQRYEMLSERATLFLAFLDFLFCGGVFPKITANLLLSATKNIFNAVFFQNKQSP
jgi:hypothetical protein